MNAHELARMLLAGPDLPVIINGWGSDEGNPRRVKRVSVPDTEPCCTPKDFPELIPNNLGYVTATVIYLKP